MRSVLNSFTLRLAPEHLDTIIDRRRADAHPSRQFARRLASQRLHQEFQRLSAMDVSQRMMVPARLWKRARNGTLFQLIDGLLVEEGPTPLRIKPAGDAAICRGPSILCGGPPHTIVANPRDCTRQGAPASTP